eukprot:TRINITY_DN11923_c0_g1_i1.p1 TRINITY_DN11923_c0_g1~~TRINITY_DN11923_c0_g1_i1.p1  ORF type:complete len:191 (-),score=27.78 TRINITY_DN11923_c0_g1_i1:59-631(-)
MSKHRFAFFAAAAEKIFGRSPTVDPLHPLDAPAHWRFDPPQVGGPSRRPPPRLLACNVACMRGGEVIFRDMNLSLFEGGAAMLTGPNGSGKSSMLRLLAGFISPSAGWLKWDGHNLADRDIYDVYRTNVHLMGSKDAIKPQFTIDENVRLWADLEGTGQRVSAALAAVGLGEYIDDSASVLSLGLHLIVN